MVKSLILLSFVILAESSGLQRYNNNNDVCRGFCDKAFGYGYGSTSKFDMCLKQSKRYEGPCYECGPRGEAGSVTCRYGLIDFMCCRGSRPKCCQSKYCADLSSDPKNCGACGKTCTNKQICKSSLCTCTSGVLGDSSNCGTCGTRCNNGQTCRGNACACTSGALNDNNNCGTCGNICSARQVCERGVCVCPGGVLGDSNNCRICGDVCANGQICKSNRCGCADGILGDSNNCGTCGNTCSSGQICKGDACGCASGTLGDTNNCGTCGTGCRLFPACEQGVCCQPAGQEVGACFVCCSKNCAPDQDEVIRCT